MFVKEVSAAILPWWALAAILFGPYPAATSGLLLIGAYILLTEIMYQRAIKQSRKDGFKRIVRVPIRASILRLLAAGRFDVPDNVPCYTLHIHSKRTGSPRDFFHELEDDIRHGFTTTNAFFAGSTFTDLAPRINSVLGAPLASVVEGVLVPGQRWNVDPERHQLRLFNRIFNRPNELEWKIVLIQTQGSNV